MLSCFSCAGFCAVIRVLYIYRYQCASRGILSIFFWVILKTLLLFLVGKTWAKAIGMCMFIFFANIKKKMLKIRKMSNSYNIVTIFGKIWRVGYEFLVWPHNYPCLCKRVKYKDKAWRNSLPWKLESIWISHVQLRDRFDFRLFKMVFVFFCTNVLNNFWQGFKTKVKNLQMGRMQLFCTCLWHTKKTVLQKYAKYPRKHK